MFPLIDAIRVSIIALSGSVLHIYTSNHQRVPFLYCHTLYSFHVLTFVLKVSEMKAEYFPPKEDVILQNEAPTDLYILVTGAVVRTKILLPFRPPL